MTFKQLGLSVDMLETLTDIGFDKPSAIQEQGIPVALSGKDVIGQAHTGTGKTAAFGIPVIERVSPRGGLQSIILAPSRELAVQIYNELQKLSSHKDINVIEIIGGISYDKQKRDLRKNPEIIVATPGRFIDHMNNGMFNLSAVSSFVLDEADEMLSFGFLKEIKKISAELPKTKQTLFFTATFNKKIKDLADVILNKPVTIQVSDGLSTSERVEQKMIVLKENQKLRTLVTLLQMLKPQAAMVFGRTRRRVDELSASLVKLGFKAIGIQGDMRQRERSTAMSKFRAGNINILVGTDVMARGIDVDNVDFVFNFDLPSEVEYYTHRIGRTGRAGKKGISVSFVKDTEKGYFRQVMKQTNSEVEEWPLPSDKDIADIREKDLEKDIQNLYHSGKDKFQKIGQNIAAKYTKEELGIIIANQLIGKKASIFDIKLTGEQGVNGKKSNSRGNGRGNRRRGGQARTQGGGGKGGGARRTSKSTASGKARKSNADSGKRKSSYGPKRRG